jgi:hypothetical protein
MSSTVIKRMNKLRKQKRPKKGRVEEAQKFYLPHEENSHARIFKEEKEEK